MKTVLNIILFVVIIAAGVGVFILLASSKTEAKRKSRPGKVTIVDAIEATAVSEKAIVNASGTVVPAKSVTLAPEVSGKIIAQSDKLVPGGRLKKGNVLVRLDSRDHDLALQQRRTQVVAAEMNLATEKGRKAVAEKEWSLIRDEVRPSEEGRRLALREVQLDNAEAALDGAKSAVEQAALNRSRTVIRAPFNSFVTEEFVDKGQVVGPGTPLATLVASDVFWVRVSVPMDRLSWLSIPGVNGERGSPVRIVQQVGVEEHVVRNGRVIRLLGDLDPVGKMARVLVEVEDPLGEEKDAENRGLPLLLGAYVSVEIEGPTLTDLIALPRRAIREDDTVWIKTDDLLSIRKIRVVWTKGETVYVRGDVEPGEAVITSRIGAPVEGMKVALPEETVDPEKSKDSAPSNLDEGEKGQPKGQAPPQEKQ